ncbi:MAG: DUF4838 domain-containing protein [Saprospirales bacterium]|nr:DUF4838 domain-containing protein [Saprospirales bacterium]
MRGLSLLFLLAFSTCLRSAQSNVVVVADAAVESNLRAAKVLQHYLEEMTGGNLVDLRPFGTIPPHTTVVFIGYDPSLSTFGFHTPPSLPEDGYYLEGNGGHFFIAGGGELGAEYGVYDLLERLGCRKYSPRDAFIPKVRALRLPNLSPTTAIPAFPYRELWYEPAFDEEWARWHKLKTNPKKNAEWGLFVHTFDKLCPAEEHFAAHPEYYSWNGAQYSPGQLCLSNDTVRQIVVASLRKLIEESPPPNTGR